MFWELGLFLAGDTVDAGIEFLNLFRDVLLVLNEGFLNTLKQLLVAGDSPQNN